MLELTTGCLVGSVAGYGLPGLVAEHVVPSSVDIEAVVLFMVFGAVLFTFPFLVACLSRTAWGDPDRELPWKGPLRHGLQYGFVGSLLSGGLLHGLEQ